MNTTIKKPTDWLENLNKAIMSTRCRYKGETFGLDEGCLHTGELIKTVIQSGNTIWWVGNGGSAAICSHLSQDLLNKLGARSFFLGDVSLMTCMANDFGYENVYLKPLEKLTRPGDLLIAISSSGNSENIVSCARFAEQKEMKSICLSGFKEDNRLNTTNADVCFHLPATSFGLVEVGHEAILHGIIEWLWLKAKTI